MTHTSTEQERAEFQRLMALADNFGMVCAEMGDVAKARKELREALASAMAARRAQAAPHGWSLHEAAKDALDWLEDEDLNMTHNIRERLRTALAAAPRPPETATSEAAPEVSHAATDVACNPSMQPELATKTAPVQLPEPQAEIEVRSMKTYLDLSIHEWRDSLPDGEYKVYTEQQVRELLAAHGIGKDKA